VVNTSNEPLGLYLKSVSHKALRCICKAPLHSICNAAAIFSLAAFYALGFAAFAMLRLSSHSLDWLRCIYDAAAIFSLAALARLIL